MTQLTANDIITYWFEELEPADWFKNDPELDKAMKDRFEAIYLAATRGELAHWRKTIEGRLAEIILLDQFSRNFYRNDPRAFSQDTVALVLAQEALPMAEQLPIVQQGFLYMPFMHSESLVIHEQALKLFDRPGLEKRLNYEKMHYTIIKQFGRFPSRNKALGRTSTPEELAFLKDFSAF